jgi:hypothetical protein
LTIYQAARKVHLWVGLLLSLVLLIEAVTGLILAEPGLWGQEKPRPPMAADELRSTSPPPTRLNQGTPPASGLTMLGLAKNLHQGRWGKWNAKWLVDLAAIGMILLTLTGIYIAIPLLRTRGGRRDRP